jgi:hypothetical protein
VQGIEVLGGTPEQFAAYIREETAKWAKVIKAGRCASSDARLAPVACGGAFNGEAHGIRRIR